MPTDIEWTHFPGYTGETWNPVTGCSKVSAGCKNCYAEAVANRFWRGRKFTDVQCHEDRLAIPLKWNKPRAVFVNSMSDLFHEAVPSGFIHDALNVMRQCQCPRHIFIILTKRHERLRGFEWKCATHKADFAALPNVILGVSVENQEQADARIPALLATPAAVRCVSYEPAIGSVDFTRVVIAPMRGIIGTARNCLSDSSYGAAFHIFPDSDDAPLYSDSSNINWIIVGGESGPGARPFNVEWARQTVRQCKAAGVACFVKQMGGVPVLTPGRGDTNKQRADDEHAQEMTWPDGTHFGNRTGRPELNGYQILLNDPKGGDWSEWPEDLRVRDFPKF